MRHKILRDFEIKTDNLIPAGRPEQVITNDSLVDFAVQADLRVKMKEHEKIRKHLSLARELKKPRKMRA